VNADDYGYFPGVSRGIIECARQTVITAAGIISNSPYFDEHIKWLKEVETIDTGLHLNLTYGRPLATGIARTLSKWNGYFPGKLKLSIGLSTHQIPLDLIVEECRSQIRRCLDAGLTLNFINSHEHIHMWPMLYSKVCKLADEFNVAYIRNSKPEWDFGLRQGYRAGVIRDLFLQPMFSVNQRCRRKLSPELIGMSGSGKLTYKYLEKRFSSLQPGRIYELMCHPGHTEPLQVYDQRLLFCHNWEGELRLLKSNEFHKLCKSCGIQLIRFRDLADGYQPYTGGNTKMGM
jgi:chitin disaccharide deacetylase